MHEKAVYYQTQVSDELRREIVEIQREIDKEEAGREDALAQAKTGDKAELARALHRTLESLQQAISLLLSLDSYGVNRPCEDRTRETHDESTVCFFRFRRSLTRSLTSPSRPRTQGWRSETSRR